MARKRKYNYYYVLQGDYGSGWDDLCQYDKNDPEARKELISDRKSYRENEPQYRHRVISRRVPIFENK